MPRQKDTKRIDPSRARQPGDPDEPHNVFKVSGSPIISPRCLRQCVEEKGPGKRQKQSNGGVSLPNPPTPEEESLVAAAAANLQAQEAKKALKSEQAANRSFQGLSGVQLVVHQLLATHSHTLARLGVDIAAFPNTRLSLNQVETLLSPMLSMCNALRAEHFGIHIPTPEIALTMNDVHYWKLWESDTIDIGIFFMPPNSRIPLHNHPGMSVATRVLSCINSNAVWSSYSCVSSLYGTASVTSYDLVSEKEIEKLETGSEIVYEESTFNSDILNPGKKSVSWARISRVGEYKEETTTWLDPRRFNLHNIKASSDIGCAMLDIMVPPYDNANRDCHHFKIIEERLVRNEKLFKMLEAVKDENHMNPTSSIVAESSTPPGS